MKYVLEVEMTDQFFQGQFAGWQGYASIIGQTSATSELEFAREFDNEEEAAPFVQAFKAAGWKVNAPIPKPEPQTV